MDVGIWFTGYNVSIPVIIEGNIIQGRAVAVQTQSFEPQPDVMARIVANHLAVETGDSEAAYIASHAGDIRSVLFHRNLIESPVKQLVLSQVSANTVENVLATDNRFKGAGINEVNDATWSSWSDNHVYDAAIADARGALLAQP